MNSIDPNKESSSKQRVLITGVSGLVGRILFTHLSTNSSSEYDFFGLDQHLKRSPRYELEPDSIPKRNDLLFISADQFIECDITDQQHFNQIIQYCQIDIIIHLAAVLETDPNPDRIFDVNIQGTKNVLQAHGVKRVINVSTVRTVFGYLEREPYLSMVNNTFDDRSMLKQLKEIRVEDDLPLPQCLTPSIEAYWKSKVIGEQMCKEILKDDPSKSIICVRLGWVNISDDPGQTFYRSIWLSHRDLCSFFDKLLQSPLSINGTYFAISNNHRLWVDINPSKEQFNFVPQDGATII